MRDRAEPCFHDPDHIQSVSPGFYGLWVWEADGFPVCMEILDLTQDDAHRVWIREKRREEAVAIANDGEWILWGPLPAPANAGGADEQAPPPCPTCKSNLGPGVRGRKPNPWADPGDPDRWSPCPDCKEGAPHGS